MRHHLENVIVFLILATFGGMGICLFLLLLNGIEGKFNGIILAEWATLFFAINIISFASLKWIQKKDTNA